MPEKFFQAQNSGASRVFSAIVSQGVEHETFRLRCSNGAVITFPKALFPHLMLDDQPSIVLSIIVTKIVEAEPPQKAN